MYLDPYTKHDDEAVELLAKSTDDLLPEVKESYLINILTYPQYQNMTIKEVLKAEVEAKEAFEAKHGQTKKV